MCTVHEPWGGCCPQVMVLNQKPLNLVLHSIVLCHKDLHLFSAIKASLSCTPSGYFKYTLVTELEWWLRDAGVTLRRYPQVEVQRRSPSKMVGGAKSHLKSNCIPTRDFIRAQTNHVCTQRSRETETELRLSISCRGMGQQWTAVRAGALGAVDQIMA